MATESIRWTHEDMVTATVEYWGDDSIAEDDCEVVRRGDHLVVLHRATGRTSDEAGDAGCWNLDGTAR